MQHQTQTQRQTLKILPQQIQMLNLIQLSTIELENRIKSELEENPVLEEGSEDENQMEAAEPEVREDNEVNSSIEDQPQEELYNWEKLENDVPDYKTRSDNHSDDDGDSYTIPMVQTQTFREDLKEQLHLLNLSERYLIFADFILDSLDDDGFLRFPLNDLADDISFAHNLFVDVEELKDILLLIQKLDPPGIGASDLQECLLLQLEAKKNAGKNVDTAIMVVNVCMNELAHKNYEKIKKILSLSNEDLKEVVEQITSLNPKPVSGQASDIQINLNIYPEFNLFFENDKIEVSLNNKSNQELRLNKSFMDMAHAAGNDKQTIQFVKSKISAAQWFIDAIKQRENTMLTTMKAIAILQQEYFMTGNERKLRPMILKDVADIIGMDISTVSRVTSTKYVQTPFGLILLKRMFSEGLTNQDGAEVSNREIQNHIQEIIQKEDKNNPLTDQQIVDALSQKGYNIARRTVAKYREHLNIAVAKLRRGL